MSKKDSETVNVLTSNQIIKAAQKANADKHLNDVETVYHITSTGSLVWDIKLGGGLCPGIHRFVGPPESGKTSAAFEICRNFMAGGKHRRGLYVKSEGRLSKEMMERSGLKFTSDIDEWEDGMIYVVKSNIYEYCTNLIRSLVKGGLTEELYCIIVDSTDGMILDADASKSLSEHAKVAGTPSLTKKFFQNCGNEIGERGHLCLMLSQFSSNIQLDTYATSEDKRPKQSGGGGGGWALVHWANWAFEFSQGWNKHDILEDSTQKAGPKNERVGKRAIVKIRKSLNETTDSIVEYPIKFKVIGGSSIWISMEVFDLCLATGRVRRSGSWLVSSPNFVSEVKAAGEDIPEKLQGEDKFYGWFEEHTKACDVLFEQFRKGLTEKVGNDAF